MHARKPTVAQVASSLGPNALEASPVQPDISGYTPCALPPAYLAVMRASMLSDRVAPSYYPRPYAAWTAPLIHALSLPHEKHQFVGL